MIRRRVELARRSFDVFGKAVGRRTCLQVLRGRASIRTPTSSTAGEFRKGVDHQPGAWTKGPRSREFPGTMQAGIVCATGSDWIGRLFMMRRELAILPIGFCYPGADETGGDRPPRPECAPRWHARLLELLPDVRLTLLVGQYAQRYYLRPRAKWSMTETVRNFSECGPQFFPLPHPSWRSAIWMRKHRWFEERVVPQLRKVLQTLI